MVGDQPQLLPQLPSILNHLSVVFPIYLAITTPSSTAMYQQPSINNHFLSTTIIYQPLPSAPSWGSREAAVSLVLRPAPGAPGVLSRLRFGLHPDEIGLEDLELPRRWWVGAVWCTSWWVEMVDIYTNFTAAIFYGKTSNTNQNAQG